MAKDFVDTQTGGEGAIQQLPKEQEKVLKSKQDKTRERIDKETGKEEGKTERKTEKIGEITERKKESMEAE
jgi:hypothetical protein